MNEHSLNFLKELLATPTPSGFEMPGQRLVMREMEGKVDSLTTDIMGNLIACLNPNASLKVILDAHCDEVGYMVNFINDDGYLYLGRIGVPRLCCASAQKVLIHNATGFVPGVMMRKAARFCDTEGYEKNLKEHHFWVDIGVNSKVDAEKYVSIGDPVTIEAGFFTLKNNLAVARAFDDRIGVFIIAETLKRLQKSNLDVTVFGVSTVQEETGGRGAQVSGFNLRPDISIAIDVIDASDSPEPNEKQYGSISLGAGPVLLKGCNITPALGAFLIKLANENKIPYQIKAAPSATSTDADPLHRLNGGSATALVEIPVRYMHAPTEIVSLDDVENAVKLLVVFLESIDDKVKLNSLHA